MCVNYTVINASDTWPYVLGSGHPYTPSPVSHDLILEPQLLLNLTALAGLWVMRWLQLRFDFASTSIRRPFDCLSNVVKVTVT